MPSGPAAIDRMVPWTATSTSSWRSRPTCGGRWWPATPAADGAHLADDFVGLYPTGFADRSEHVGQLAGGPTVASFALDQVRLVPVAESAALLCYRASFRRPGASASGPAEVMYVSSLWCRRDGRWVNTFSQDTPASDERLP